MMSLIHEGIASSSSISPTMNNRTQNGLKAVDIQHVLRDRVAILTGGRDRHGRPIITFPSRENSEKPGADDLRLVLCYLHAIPSDETKEFGFVILVDMRRGITWNVVKTILRTLQDHFPGSIHAVYIIKSDRFWEKQRASITSAKYKFEVQMISVENLHRFVDPSQLTSEFDGSLLYNHDDWVELRVALETLIWRLTDLLRVFDQMNFDMKNGQLPVDVQSAQTASNEHLQLRKEIQNAPVDGLEEQGRQLMQRLTSNNVDDQLGGGDSDYGSAGKDGSMTTIIGVNPDFSSAAPHLTSLLNILRTTREQLYVQWTQRRQKLDHCYQLKLFEQDADKWICTHVALFLERYAIIGESHEEALKISKEHDDFATAAMNTCVNVNHILTVAKRLLETGNYGRPQIHNVANRLEQDWKMFGTALDTRGVLLTLSVNFHYKANLYMNKSDEWLVECSDGPIDLTAENRNIQELDAHIHQHQQLMDSITQAYSETIRDGRALLQSLRDPPPLDVLGQHPTTSEVASLPNCSSSTSSTDYSTTANHILGVIHDLIGRHRRIETGWQQRRVRLHQRLALLLFEQDVRQVIEWLDNHGELFLRKNTGMGKTLQRARLLQKSQLHFENVAKNTYTNAEKLLAAAEELAGTGDCKPEEVYDVARELQRRISIFAKQVQARRHLLNLSVLFHTHFKEILAWYDEVDKDDQQVETIGRDLQECEAKQDAWLSRTDATLQAYATAVGEGQQLGVALRQQAAAENADNTDSLECSEKMLGEIERRQTKLADRWQRQRLALQLGAKFALFQQDCTTVAGQLQGWRDDMREMSARLTPQQAEKVLPLHRENTEQVHAAMLEIVNMAQEQIQVLESSGFSLTIVDGRSVHDCIVALADGVKQHERDVMQTANQTSLRLDQALQLGRHQSAASQIIAWIVREEHVLHTTLLIPFNVEEALQAQKEHAAFQLAVEKTNQNAVGFQEKADQMIALHHYDAHGIRILAEEVLAKWRRLVGLTEERNKLLTSAVTYYKTLDQVLPVLDNLEQDYSQLDRDWCSQFSTQPRNENSSFAVDKTSFISELLSKHMDTKERFMKGCSYARKNSELFLKYVRRCQQWKKTTFSSNETKILDTLEQFRQRENRILQLWTKKKDQLDRCQEFVLLEATAKNTLDWLHDKGEEYLSTCQNYQLKDIPVKQIEQYLQVHLRFHTFIKEQREKVALFLELADKILQKVPRHRHHVDIQQWTRTVRQRFEDFLFRIAKLETKLQHALGSPEESTGDFRPQRLSDPNLDAKMTKSKDLSGSNEEESRLNKQMQCVMTELIATERAYVNDLETCINCYLKGYRERQTDCPLSLKDKEKAIFGNIEELHRFHRDTFLKELQNYEHLAEDVGHCFITWAERLEKHYTAYCVNKDQTNHLIGQSEAVKYFSKIQHENDLSHQLQALLIKPVQRITRYQLLLDKLADHCKNGTAGEIREALEVMLSVPKRANDIIHLNLLDGYSELENSGECLIQGPFTVWEPKQIIKKGRERQVFLFDLCVVFSKKVEAPNVKAKYIYKNRLMLSEINVTEHIEGDPCKLALWTGNVPNNEFRTILKTNEQKIKLIWVKQLRQLIGERILHLAMPQLMFRKSSTALDQDRASKDSESLTNTTEGSVLNDRISVHSCASSSSNETTQQQQV